MKLRVIITLTLVSMLILAAQVWGEDSLTASKGYNWSSFFGKPFFANSNTLVLVHSTPLIQGVQLPSYKSPKKALMLSALLPGAGELYAKSRLKSLVFFSIEVAAWVSYVYFYKDGKRQEDQYINYADQNWSREVWENWWNIVPEDEKKTTFASETLPDTKTQQYYEMIGKYDKFNAGWNDVQWTTWQEGYKNTSGRRLYYMDLRYWSNRALKYATAATMIVLANHVISALDAAWTAHRHNQSQAPVAIQLRYVQWEGQPQMVAELTLKW
ncbi:hypothetical protein DRP98_01515 [candidate division KSB1 bacterium]|nr:MAG: hypothetical protein DRP98_01515 [candidate division KSB1 bacterium]